MIVVILSNDHIWTYNLRKEIIQAIIQQGHKVFLIMPYGEKVTELCGMGCNFIDIPFERHGTNVIKEIKILYYYHKYLKK